MMTSHSKKEPLFYLQDSRQYVGNCVLWWAKGGAGYTTKLDEAMEFPKQVAITQNRCRETDIPWEVNYVKARLVHTFDMQRGNAKESLLGTGVRLKAPKRQRPTTTGKTRGNCPECGKITWDYDPEHNAYCFKHAYLLKY